MPDKKTQAEALGNNPNVQSSGGGINPSAPATGTEAWGHSPDEKRMQVVQNNPAASSPNAEGAGDIRHTSYPQNEAAQNPAARMGAHGTLSLHCSAALEQSCPWSVTASGEEELLGYLRSHARSAHGKTEFTPKELADARHAILKSAA